MEPVTETQLIGRIIEGRWDLFGELLQPHITALARMVQAKMSNDSDAEHVVQQTIVKALIG
jgi:DNA-directed RNA polymerase specialized sigma24 family protein